MLALKLLLEILLGEAVRQCFADKAEFSHLELLFLRRSGVFALFGRHNPLDDHIDNAECHKG